MLECTENITIYTSVYNPVTRANDKWFKTQIKDVSWFGRLEIGFATTGIVNADIFQIRIPIDANFMGKTYIEPIAWLALTDVERTTKWTIQKDDIIFKGLLTDEITSTVTIAKLQKDHKGYNGKIVSVHDNRRGSLPIQHWAVVAQ